MEHEEVVQHVIDALETGRKERTKYWFDQNTTNENFIREMSPHGSLILEKLDDAVRNAERMEEDYRILEADRHTICTTLAQKEAALRSVKAALRCAEGEITVLKRVLADRTDALLTVRSKLRSTRTVVEDVLGM